MITKEQIDKIKQGIAVGRLKAEQGIPEQEVLEVETDEWTKQGIREGYQQHFDQQFRDSVQEYKVARLRHKTLGDSIQHVKFCLHRVIDAYNVRRAHIADALDFKLRKELPWKYSVDDLDGNHKYTITKSNSGKWSCSCTGFTYRHKCKHVDELMRQLNEGTGDRLPQHLARVRQLEKSLKVWEDRLNDPKYAKQAQKQVEARKQALDAAKKIAAEIEARPKPQRHDRSEFLGVVPLLDKLFDGLGKYEIVGSWRRGKDTYKDVDILTVMTPKEWATFKDRLQEDDNFGPAPGHTHPDFGDEVIRGGYRNGTRYDYLDVNRVPNPDEWGAWLLFRTGSAQFNIAMRGYLKKFGCGLNERGLIGPDGNVVASKTEEDIFSAIGIPYIKPEDREDARIFYQEVRKIDKPKFLENESKTD